MDKKFSNMYIRFNEQRERMGLPRLGRRQFIKVALSTTAGLSLPFTIGCGSSNDEETDELKGQDGGQSDDKPVSTCEQCVQVGIAKESSTVKSVRAAIDLSGGLSQIKGGDKVVIKPNISGAYPYGTRSEVIQAVIQAVKQFTKGSNITVADAAAFGNDTQLKAEEGGIVKACEEEDATFLPFDRHPYVGFQASDWSFIPEEKQVPEILNPKDPQYDHFINLPLLKNHEAVPNSGIEFTCCLKNFVGILPFNGEGGRMSPAPAGIHNQDLGNNVAELGKIVPKITLNVVDALTPVIQYGPGGEVNGFPPMVTVDAGLILACQDRVACDSVAVAILRHYAIEEEIDMPYLHKPHSEQAQIKHAAEIGLGICDAKKIELLGEDEEIIEMIKAQLS